MIKEVCTVMKKIISIIITISCILAMIPSAMAQNYEKTTTETSSYERGIKLFEALTGENLFGEAEEKVTRGQFADMLIKATNAYFPTDGYTSKVTFTDVTKENENYYSIGCLADSGAVSEAEKFNPNDVILMNEAVKMTVSFVGYGIMAENNGGYPGGYLNAANEMKLLKDIKLSNELTNADAATMLYNLMFADAMKYYDETKTYQKSNSNYLKLYFDTYYTEGIINQTTYNSTIYGFESVDNGVIQIDGISYKYGEMGTDMLGKNVTAFYKDNGGEDTIIAIVEEKNTSVVIESEDYEKIEDNRLYYFENSGKTEKSYKLNKSYVVIFNGRRASALTDKMLSDPDAEIKLLDNDNDNAFDMIFIKSNVYGTLTTVDYTNDILVLETPEQITVKMNDSNGLYTIYDAEGNETELALLEKKSIVSARISEDEKIIEIRALDNFVSGKIDAMDNANKKLTVNGVEYETTDQFWQKYVEKEQIIKTGATINAAVTAKGTMVALKDLDSKYVYGYMLKFIYDDGMFDETFQIKMFTSNGVAENIKISEKTTVNGTRCTREQTYNVLGGSAVTAQLVKYMLNSDGEIARISTAQTMEDYETRNPDYKFGDNLPDEVLMQTATRPATNSLYRTDFAGFTGYAATGSAKVFVVPTTDVQNPDKYEIITMSSLPGNSRYDWTLYDVDITGRPKVVVLKGDNNMQALRSREFMTMFVENVENAIDENNMEGYMINGWVENKLVGYFMEEEKYNESNAGYTTLSSPGLSQGDIIRINLNGSSIDEYRIDFEYNATTKQFKCVSEDNSNDIYFMNTAVTQNNVSNYGYYGQGGLCWVEGNIYAAESDYGYIGLNTKTTECGDDLFKYSNMRLCKMTSTILCFTRGEQRNEIRPISLEELKTYRNSGSEADHVIMQLKSSKNYVTYVIR